ncbi:MAG TPA: 2-phosphosulfolactate phosphatase [Pseudonocardiaceae bacterium]|nr:2-phosphosulfolactate phosphatase [Pseudonocardiaceae bacterium]
MPSPYAQHDYGLRLEWGVEGVTTLAPDCAVLVVVDVMSFCTTVSVAIERGAAVLPLAWRDGATVRSAEAAGPAEAARPAGAVLAVDRRERGWSLSPSSLRTLPAGTTLELPSPNGATLSTTAAGLGCRVLAGCLRNVTAVATMASRLAGGGAIAVVPAGERWRLPDAPLRPAFEDLVGAGALAGQLLELGHGPASPEARAAVAAFRAARREGLAAALAGCASGRELEAEGFGADVALAAEYDACDQSSLLRDGIFGGANAAELEHRE